MTCPLSVQAALTEHHRPGDWGNRCSFLMVLEAGKSKMKVLADSVTGEGSLPGLQTAVSSYGREKGLVFHVSFVLFRYRHVTRKASECIGSGSVFLSFSNIEPRRGSPAGRGGWRGPECHEMKE